MSAQQLPGMPLPWPLAVTRTGDGRAVSRCHAGPMLLSAFGAGDLEMRDLTICALTEGSRFQGKTVAAAFGIQPSQVSRSPPLPRARRQGPGPPDGPPADPQPRPGLRQARTWAGQGLTHAEIGRKLGMSRSRITELIKQHGVLLTPGTLSGDADDTGADPAARDGGGTGPGQHAGTTGRRANRTPAAATAPEPAASAPAPAPARAAGEAAMTGPAPRATGTAGAGRWRPADRVRDGCLPLRGRDAVHAFTSRIGAQGLLRSGTGASAGTGASGAGVDDLGILVCTQMSFTLGALTMEQAKHLIAADAGALAGLTSLPSLRTWRQRLGERLADGCDPLALQRRLASQMLAIEPAESQVYLADDHLAEYTGHQAVALGRNPRRGKRPRATTTPISVTWPAGRSRSPPASPRRCAPRCPARWRRSPAPSRPAPGPARTPDR